MHCLRMSPYLSESMFEKLAVVYIWSTQNGISAVCKHFITNRGGQLIEAGSHIYASLIRWIIIGSGNGLSPVRCQAITWTNADLLSIESIGTSFSEIMIDEFKHFHWRKCVWKCRLQNVGHFFSAAMCYSAIGAYLDTNIITSSRSISCEIVALSIIELATNVLIPIPGQNPAILSWVSTHRIVDICRFFNMFWWCVLNVGVNCCK